MDDDDKVLARFGGATIFLVAAGVSLPAAWLGATMESYTSWGDPDAVTWTIFSAANIVAAMLAGLPWGSWPMRFAGFLLIVPAVVVMDAAAPGGNDIDPTIVAAAVAIVLLGGALAGGLVARLFGRRT